MRPDAARRKACDRRRVLGATCALVVLTGVEALVYRSSLAGPALLIPALVTLTLFKLCLVAAVFMNLGREAHGLRRAVLWPLALPLFLAFVLIAEAAWRLP